MSMGQTAYEKDVCNKIIEVKMALRRHNYTPKERQAQMKRLENLYNELKEEVRKNSNAEQRLNADVAYIEQQCNERGMR